MPAVTPTRRLTSGTSAVATACGAGVELGAQYVFISEGIVYSIGNQDFQDLVRLAGQDVQLEGEVRHKVLTVSRISPLTVGRSNGTRSQRTGSVS